MSDLYKPSQAGFKEMANSSEMHGLLAEVAEKAKAFAEGLASDFRRTGDYQDSFAVVPETLLWKRPRAAARLENTSDHAAAVEWGTKNDQVPHHTLKRTLDALKAL